MNNTRFPELVKQMKEHKEPLSKIATLIQQANTSQISRRLSGKIEFTISEAKILCNHYNIKFEELFREEE